MNPTFQLIYFKHILDDVFVNFFEIYNSYFEKDGNIYILKKSFTHKKLEKTFEFLVLESIKKYIEKKDLISSKKYFIIGGCIPKDNILLKFKGESYFPEKLQKILDEKPGIKYILKEKDIHLDYELFNKICMSIFNSFFTKNLLVKKLGEDYSNVYFIQHRRLDCYQIFKIIKHIYGRKNCNNLFLEKMSENKQPIVALNDLISKYVNNKEKLAKDSEFQEYVLELKTFLEKIMVK